MIVAVATPADAGDGLTLRSDAWYAVQLAEPSWQL